MQRCSQRPPRALRGTIATMLAGIVMLMMLGPCESSKLRSRQIPTPPKAGDLVHEVKEQLADDHRTLGKVSASLMSVQTDVDKTEESMLGKVLDLQTARSFFTRHEEIDTSNDKMKEDITKLNTQVEDLSSTLSKTQREFLNNGHENRGTEGKLRTQAIEDKALIESMNAELAQEDEVQKALKRLTKIHKDLMVEQVNVTDVGRKATTLLDQARATASGEVGKHRSLRHQLVKMNNYSIACHGNVVKASKKLGMMMVVESKDSEAATLTLRQKKRANDASEQRLLAERALLVSEVKRIENEETQELARIKDLREDMRVLEKSIVKQTRALEEKIKNERERVKSLGVDLMENSQAEMEHNLQKEAMEAQIDKLMSEVRDSENPIIVAQTEGQNDALQAELTEAYVLWKTAKTSETAAALNVDQAAAEAVATKEAEGLAEEALVAARKEGRKKVAEAVKVAAKSKAKSMALFQKAQAAVAARCKPDWDSVWKKKRAKLVKCKTMKQELTLEEAKKESLISTLQASVELT